MINNNINLNFSGLKKYREATGNRLMHLASDDDRQSYEDIFKRIDSNKNGVISKPEMMKMMTNQRKMLRPRKHNTHHFVTLI